MLDGTREVLESGQVDLCISPSIPPNFNGEILTEVRYLPVARPDHALHQLGRDLTMRDLRQHRQQAYRWHRNFSAGDYHIYPRGEDDYAAPVLESAVWTHR